MEDNLFTFGISLNGELGLGDMQSQTISIPTQVSNFKVRQVSCGHRHTVLIDMQNNVWSCGFNNKGQLGLSHTYNRNIFTMIPNIKAKQVSCGYSHTMLIDLEDNVWTFGDNKHGELGLNSVENCNIPSKITSYIHDDKPVERPIKALKIFCGGFSSIIIDHESNIYICGDAIRKIIENHEMIIPTQISKLWL